MDFCMMNIRIKVHVWLALTSKILCNNCSLDELCITVCRYLNGHFKLPQSATRDENNLELFNLIAASFFF